MISTSSYNPIANQFIINDGKGNEYFQSYQSIIVKRANDGKTYLDEYYWDYSRTTGKYRNQFLGDTSIAETRRKIKDGTYILTSLNY